MKRIHLVLLAVCFSSFLLACSQHYPGTAREEMPGTYEAHGKTGTEVIIIQSDGGYIHSFESANGYSYTHRGDWKYYPPAIEDPDKRTVGFAHLQFLNWNSYQHFPDIDTLRHSTFPAYVGKGNGDRVATIRPLDPESRELTFLKK